MLSGAAPRLIGGEGNRMGMVLLLLWLIGMGYLMFTKPFRAASIFRVEVGLTCFHRDVSFQEGAQKL